LICSSRLSSLKRKKAINKKILQIIDFAGFIYFLVLFKNFKFAPGGE